MRTERTKKMINMRNLFLWLDYFTFIVTTGIMIFSALAHVNSGKSASAEVFSKEFVNAVTSMAVTGVIGIVMAIFIKDKMRTTLFMIDVIISSLVFGSIGMYVVLGVWFIDEYVFHQLYGYYREKASINKEIDLRE